MRRPSCLILYDRARAVRGAMMRAASYAGEAEVEFEVGGRRFDTQRDAPPIYRRRAVAETSKSDA